MFRYSFLLIIFISSSSFATTTTSQAPYRGMVVSEHALASQIGADILKAGGNAIDAAVAVGYALAVVSPCCGNIGGGGFMTIHFANGKNTFFNFREKAPLKADKKIYLNSQGHPLLNKSTKGYLAVGVPGSVLGFDTALQKYGTMTRAQVMEPAIKLAQNGFRVSPYFATLLRDYSEDLRTQPNVTAIFFKNGVPYQSGDLLVQKDLANTLRLIETQGPNAFYRGPIAQAVVKASDANGGILTLQDFADYTVEELSPIYCDYHGYTIISAPPPSSGGVALCEMLNILENFPLQQLGYHSLQSTRYIIEAMRYGYIDRNKKLGDPDFVHNPIQQLISKTYAKEISKKIQNGIIDSIEINNEEKLNTTHYSVLDKQGNAVAVTYTLNGAFGASIIAGNTGFFLNDQMDDFAITTDSANRFGLIQSDANLIEGGKRPLSSTTPTIVLKQGKLFLIIGSPGGPRIISSVLLSLLNIIDYHLNLKQAIEAPRFHFQAQPDWIDNEPFAFTFATKKGLQMMGYYFDIPSIWGSVEAIQIDQKGTVRGESDPRRPDGAAISE